MGRRLQPRHQEEQAGTELPPPYGHHLGERGGQVWNLPRHAGRLRRGLAQQGGARAENGALPLRDRPGPHHDQGQGGQRAGGHRGARRRHPPGDEPGGAGQAQGGVQGGRVHHGGQRLAGDGRRGGQPAHEAVRGQPPGAPYPRGVPLLRGRRLRPRHHGHRARGGDPRGGEEGGPLCAGYRPVRAQRGLRLPGDLLRGAPRAGPREGQRQRRGHRPRPPARGDGCAGHRHPSSRDVQARAELPLRCGVHVHRVRDGGGRGLREGLLGRRSAGRGTSRAKPS
mmetsp:Transcript_52571/g.167144  ORF Transcript_52571/g.167144 Transcript_52571/m.167144 type:complete len:282 (+) Transcript_52571:630-1475(+)